MDISQNAVNEDTSAMTKNLDMLERKLFVAGSEHFGCHACTPLPSYPLVSPPVRSERVQWHPQKLATERAPHLEMIQTFQPNVRGIYNR